MMRRAPLRCHQNAGSRNSAGMPMRSLPLIVAVTLLAGCGSGASDPTTSPDEDASNSGPPLNADAGTASTDSPASTKADTGARDGKTGADTNRPAEVVLPESFLGASRGPKGALLCDGFEGAALDSAKWGFGFWTYYYSQPRDV